MNHVLRAGAVGLLVGLLVTIGAHAQGPSRLRTRIVTLEELDFSTARVQFRNAATQHYIVLRADPGGGGSLEGGGNPDLTAWYFYRADGAEFNNVEVKREPVKGFNWSNYELRTDTESFIAWNHAKRLPNATAPMAPHDWTLEEAESGLFRIKHRGGKYLELVPQSVSGRPPQIITRPGDARNLQQSWELWSERIAGRQPQRLGLRVDPAANGWATAIHNDGYLVMLIGNDRPSALTDDLARQRVIDLDSGIQDIVEVVGFPAFSPWAEGIFMNWVLLNSGIPGAVLLRDGRPSDGGHQGDRWGHKTFESTPHNPLTWSAYESFGALHECIHALQSELWKYNNPGSGWVHESYNNYLGTLRQKMVFSRYVTEAGNGFSPIIALQIPHIPIESMGPLNDGTVGGPADQGADDRVEAKKYVSDYLGYRYGNEVFFLTLHLNKGREFVQALWNNAPKYNNRSLFSVLANNGPDGIVEEAIMSHGARAALLDFGGWTPIIRRQMRNHWLPAPKNWFYVFPTSSADGSYAPPVAQAPYNQGRNIIPLAVQAGATRVAIEFNPPAVGNQGTAAHLRAQLVYRTAKDVPVYGPRVSNGMLTLDVPNGGTREGRAFLVVGVVNGFDATSDPNYGFRLNEQFRYTFRIREGATIAPTNTRPW